MLKTISSDRFIAGSETPASRGDIIANGCKPRPE